MLGLLIVLIILTAIFGIGGVIKGVLWAILIGAVLLVVAVVRGTSPRVWIRERRQNLALAASPPVHGTGSRMTDPRPPRRR